MRAVLDVPYCASSVAAAYHQCHSQNAVRRAAPPLALPLDSKLTSRVGRHLDVTQSDSLDVSCSHFERCTMADLQPGDIAFQYQTRGRGFRQFWIGVGNHLSNIWRFWRWGDPAVMHAFVVVDAHPEAGVLHTVDAAGGNLEDISEVWMNFRTGERVIPGARYFFYRAEDSEIRRRIVNIACNWASPRLHNFSIGHAVASPFRPLKQNRKSDAAALFFVEQADIAAPLRLPGTCELYKMMCSEFVTNVLIAATLATWRDMHPQYVQDRETLLQGLRDGPMGDAFAVDARGVTPSLLQQRLEKASGIRPVGFFNSTL